MKYIRLQACLLAVLLAVQLWWCLPAVVAEEQKADSAAMEANAVLNHLFGEVFTEEALTRGSFTAALIHAFGIPAAEGTSFSDVTGTTSYYGEIYAALDAGIVSEADTFEPNTEITCEQAIKMIVCALGYEAMAQECGGYPVGYLTAAKRAGLLENVSETSGALSVQNAKILFFNLLSSEIHPTEFLLPDEVYYENTGESYIKTLYGLTRLEGVVEETTYNAYYEAGAIDESIRYLVVEGMRYTYDDVSPELLGQNVCIYVDEEAGQVALLLPLDNTYQEINRDDITAFDRSRLSYQDQNSDREKNFTITGARVIYNGRFVPEITLDEVDGDYACFRLLDNNRDNVYDYVFIQDYRYIYVNAADVKNGVITDKNGTQDIFRADENGAVLWITDAAGNRIEMYEINENVVSAVAESRDKQLVQVRLCDGSKMGSIDYLNLADAEEAVVSIDGEQLDISSYAMRHYSTLLKPGGSYVLLLGLAGEVVVVEGGTGVMQYGYLVDGSKESGPFDDAVLLKIFSVRQAVEILRAEEVIFDADTARTKGENILSRLGTGGEITPQLIRYQQNSSGEVIRIDTAEICTEFDPNMDKEDEYNTLKKYEFIRDGAEMTSFRYHSGAVGCIPYFSLSSATIFSVPTDVNVRQAQAKDFEIWSYSDLINGGSYTFEVYDLNQVGDAKALVIKGTAATASRTSYMIESVKTGILPGDDGEIGIVLDVYSGGTYSTLYLDEDVIPQGKQREELCAGDIVEATADSSNRIKTIRVAFDASGDVPRPVSGTGVVFESPTTTSYFYGAVYTADGTYALLSHDAGDGGFRYDFENLRQVRIPSGGFALINRQRNEIRRMDSAELKDYLTCGNDNYFLVVRISSSSILSAFAYER